MRVRWWKIRIQCPNCKVECKIIEVEHSADGEMKFTLKCPKCQNDIGWSKFTTELNHLALIRDMGAETKPEVKPDKPVVIPEKTVKDDDFLKGLGIG